MPISTYRDPRDGFYVLDVSGHPTVEELVHALGQVYEESRGAVRLDLLCDFLRVTQPPKTTVVVAVMEFARARRPPVPGRTALVADREVTYGLGRVAEAYAHDLSSKMRVFRSRALAEAWLRAGGSAEIAGSA